MIYILVFLILLVLALALYSRHEHNPSRHVKHGSGEKRPVLIFSNGSPCKQLRTALSKVQSHEPVYNPTDLGEYSNVPVIWTIPIDVGSFQRAHPGVCGGIILWYPDRPPTDTIPESTFIIQDLGKKDTDAIWELHSHHRYYVPKGSVAKHLQEILRAIR